MECLDSSFLTIREQSHPNLSNFSSTPAQLEGRSLELSSTLVKGYPVRLQFSLIALALVIQCLLLHPIFVKSALARLARFGLAPVAFLWLIKYPFQHPHQPLHAQVVNNLGTSPVCFYLALKSLEWGITRGPYYTRSFQDSCGVRRWVRNDLSDEEKKRQEHASWSIPELLGWSILQISSVRGLSFDWGPVMQSSELSVFALLYRAYKVKIAALCAAWYIVATKDSSTGTPVAVLLGLGVPAFPGLHFLAESLLNLCLGIKLCCAIDSIYTRLLILYKTIYTIVLKFGFRRAVCEFFNPINFPPLQNSPHRAQSLAEFWGSRWHSVFRRILLAVGGKPAVYLAKKAGLSLKGEKLANLFGAFFMSAVLHEYIIWAAFQPP